MKIKQWLYLMVKIFIFIFKCINISHVRGLIVSNPNQSMIGHRNGNDKYSDT